MGFKRRHKNVERLARKLRLRMPWLQPTDFPLVRTWAEFEYLAGQVYSALHTLGVVNRKQEAQVAFDVG